MPRLIVVVPTRNRPEIAINAVRSLLTCAERSFEILLSDNSTLLAHSEQLARFVDGCHDERLLLRRPPHAMSMTHHWDWALKTALERPLASHVAVLTDRMMFKNGCFDSLLAIVARHSEQIVSYDHDRVVDHRTPITVDLAPWSDEVVQLSAARLLTLSARCMFPPALPRLLNSVVPRNILEDIHSRYGTIVGSISPDYSFCYRSLALVANLVYWDRAPIVHYALGQSNGESSARGVSTAASADFLTAIEGEIFAGAPCPGIRTVRNAMLHEYCVARDESGSTKFPSIDVDAYTVMLRSEIALMENRDLANDMTTCLETWFANVGQAASLEQKEARGGGTLRRMARKWKIGPLLLRIRQKFNPAGPQLLQEHARPEFVDAGEALEYALSTNGERLPAARLTVLRSR